MLYVYISLQFEGILRGIPAGYHGFTLHQNGDIREECEAVGPHFNPHGNRHGGVDDEMRHAGDLGNIFSVRQSYEDFLSNLLNLSLTMV